RAVLLAAGDDRGALRRRIGAVGKFSRQAQLAYRSLARNLLFLTTANTLLCALDYEIEELVGRARIAREPVVERIAHRVLDDARCFRRRQPILGLALKFRLADEHRNHAGSAAHHVVAGHEYGALCLALTLGVVLGTLTKTADHPGCARFTDR